MRCTPWSFALAGLLLLLGCSLASPSWAQVSLDDLWAGRAHFEQVGELKFGSSPRGGAAESSSWFAAQGGTWYAFNRVTVPGRSPFCPSNHTQVVVRASNDKGKTWSAAAVAVQPGMSSRGDGCAVLDGSSYYDAANDTWHMLAQCLDRNNAGGWALCHYIRRGRSPLGAFSPDAANPVVRGGELWSRICGGQGKACPEGVVAEGTPDIVSGSGGVYLVTFHGVDPRTHHGFRGIAETRDFHSWQVSGSGLPDDATLGPADCAHWLAGCAGIGEAAATSTATHKYIIAEAMDRTLLCIPNQQWVFALFRGPLSQWPRSGDGRWVPFSKTPLLTRTWPDPKTGCALQYARWLIDGGDTYLIYEDWEPNHAYLHRRLLKLVAGAGSPVELR